MSRGRSLGRGSSGHVWATVGGPSLEGPCLGDCPRDMAICASLTASGRGQQSSSRVPLRLRPAVAAARGVPDRLRDRARGRGLPALPERVDRDRRRAPVGRRRPDARLGDRRGGARGVRRRQHLLRARPLRRPPGAGALPDRGAPATRSRLGARPARGARGTRHHRRALRAGWPHGCDIHRRPDALLLPALRRLRHDRGRQLGDLRGAARVLRRPLLRAPRLGGAPARVRDRCVCHARRRGHPPVAQVNRLATETSPYLLQHRDNPVDWYPWGEEALSRARAEDRPILLSIGYAACHWCHVMEHESFENEETAALMNERFVNIKVDREERPDLDTIYMAAVQAITGQGGWPMTVFLTPDGEPFYGGTYFPPEPR